MKKVEIFSSETCHFCKDAKAFFDKNGVEYITHDVSDEENRKMLVERSGQLGVPVIYIDDEMIVGFNEKKISDALGISY